MCSRLKRALALLLSLSVCCSLLLADASAGNEPVVPDDYHLSFSDVGENLWFYPYVAVLSSMGVVNGYDDGRFGPDDTARTGDAIIITLKAAAGCGDLEPLQDAHYAASYAQFAVKKGWLDWETLPDFNSAASRLFIVQLAAKALKLSPAQSGDSPFLDTDDGYVVAMYQKGLVAGSSSQDGLRFCPDDPITRAQLSAILWQVLDYQNYIQFAGQALEILPDIPVNAYAEEAFSRQNDRMSYVAEGWDSALGVDVSYYQNEIDWEKVAADGISFAMIRAGGRYYGSGTLFEDTQFRTNVQKARQAGLDVGVYFFSQAVSVEEAEEEAKFLLDLLKDCDITAPVVFDWENIDNDTARTDEMDSTSITAAAIAFCDTVETAGYQPMIYFNRYIAYLCYHLDEVDQYPFWLAEYGGTPGFYYNFAIWQYTDSGKVDGIQGPVDMNIALFPKTAP